MVAKPAASIVIPTYNRASLVSSAIETALAQTVSCEVIVCDHGSTDNTPDVVASYGSDVVYLRREADHGPFFCWLDGIVNARADYVHLTYDDDWISEHFVEKCLSVMDEQCGFSTSLAEVVSDKGRRTCVNGGWFDTGTHDARLLEWRLLNMDLTLSPGCALFRKDEAVRAINLLGAPLGVHAYHGAGPDLMMFLMPMLRYRRIGFVNEVHAYFRAHTDSITIDAVGNDHKYRRLKASYDDVREYYLLLRHAQETELASRLMHKYHWRKRVPEPLKQVVRTCRRALG